MHCKHWIEEVGESDAMCFGYEAEEGAVAIEAPGAALFDEGESRFVVAIEDFFGHLAGWAPVDQREGVGSMPLHAYDRNRGIGKDTADGCTWLKFF